MSHKRPSKHLRAPKPLRAGQTVRRRRVGDRSFLVRTIRTGQSSKDYRCPGCNQLIRSGVGHVVVWPEIAPLGTTSGIEVRRHWHSSCWERA